MRSSEVTDVAQQSRYTATLREVAAACGGEVQQRWADVLVRGVSTDTRELSEGDLFVALKGERHNGHEFLADALEAGAAAAVVHDAGGAPAELPVVVVSDPLEALGKLAAAHRAQMPVRVAAITGSTGKTTTKDMLGEILGLGGPTVTAEASHNNEIGVPLTLLRIGPEHHFCVLEFAMRGPGEIDYLAEIARPHVGVITNIGQSHVGRLGSREAIAQVKAELLEHIPETGAAVLNADDFFFSVFTAMSRCPVTSFGFAPEADVRAEDVRDEDLEGVRFRLIAPQGEAEVRMAVLGRHNVANALAACAAAAQMGAGLDQMVQALGQYEGAPMRMQRMAGRNGSTIINDAYNASPDSVAAALDVLGSVSGRKILVFGDMLEMGPEGEPAHRRVGRAAAEAGVARFIAVGDLAALAAEEAAQLGVAADAVGSVAEVATLLAPELQPGDVVLVKGSRAMGLERVVEELADEQ
ncbi:MAG: UDP-N-acetylmuramoyl-tripeptide--D-alanyl-D-alanine ligase [Armatimonadota bacterium]